VGEFTGLIDLLGALMRLLGIEENALLPAIALLIVFFVIAIPVGLLAQGRRVRTGAVGLIGEVGRAATDISPGGKVYVHSEYWDAVAGEPIGAGSAVSVVAVNGMTITVERVK